MVCLNRNWTQLLDWINLDCLTKSIGMNFIIIMFKWGKALADYHVQCYRYIYTYANYVK